MAEIGLFASVLQVAGAGLKLSKTLYQYADTVASADRRIRDIATEVELTSHIIEELATLFNHQETSQLLSENAIQTANKTLRECSAIFVELDAVVKRTQKNTLGRLILPFREPKIEIMRRHIDTLKSTLQLLLQVLVHAHQISAQKLDRQAEAEHRQQIKALLRNKKESTMKYEEYLSKYSISDECTVPGVDDLEKEDKVQVLKEKPPIAAASIDSSITVHALEQCVMHIRCLLNEIELMQTALVEKTDSVEHSNHQQNATQSYLKAREHLDSVLLGNPRPPKNAHIPPILLHDLPSNKTTKLPEPQRKGSCKPCRERRLLCDKKKPRCSACILGRKVCGGYEVENIFINVNSASPPPVWNRSQNAQRYLVIDEEGMEGVRANPLEKQGKERRIAGTTALLSKKEYEVIDASPMLPSTSVPDLSIQRPYRPALSIAGQPAPNDSNYSDAASEPPIVEISDTSITPGDGSEIIGSIDWSKIFPTTGEESNPDVVEISLSLPVNRPGTQRSPSSSHVYEHPKPQYSLQHTMSMVNLHEDDTWEMRKPRFSLDPSVAPCTSRSATPTDSATNNSWANVMAELQRTQVQTRNRAPSGPVDSRPRRRSIDEGYSRPLAVTLGMAAEPFTGGHSEGDEDKEVIELLRDWTTILE